MRVPISRIIVPLLAVFLLLPAFSYAAPPPKTIPGEILVKFQPAAKAADRAAVRASINGRVAHDFAFIGVEHMILRGVTTEQAIERLRRNPNVVYAEPNYEIQLDRVPNDPRFPELYGMRNTGQTGGTAGADIKATNAWDLFTGDPNIKIGIIDTGVDYNHPDLAANVWTNPGEIPGNSIDDDGNGYVDDVHGYDFYNNDGDPFDDNGHGSHCAGTIAGVGDNNIGVAGVNWSAKVVGIKFLSGGGSGSTTGAISSVYYAIAAGVKFTSNSWGGGGFSQALLDAINAAGAAGQLFVAASGNSGANTDTSPHYPSSYDTPYIISVAATDHNDNLASFSNYGATTVDIAAPGVNILSTTPGNSYELLSGTSMATPHVSGVVGLAWGRYPALTNMQVKTMVMNAADPKPQLAGKCVTGGRLNAFMTIAEPDETPPGTITDLMTSDPSSNAIVLHWTATGDDGTVGRASRYDIRYSTMPIDAGNFGSATAVTGPDPQPYGAAETFEVGGLAFSTTYYFAIKALDEFSNAGPISNIAMGTTLGTPDITASPLSFTSELLTGATDVQTLTLRNDGAGTLDFTIPTPNLQFSQPIAYPYEPYAKGGADPRVGPPVTDGKGGPDGFGYRWVDSDEPGGPAFSWVDITGVGTQLATTGDDAISPAVPIGFDFPFYGGTFSSVRVCTNGFLSFTDASTAYANQGLPNSGAPANLVAPFWMDLNFGTTPRAYTYNDGSRFIVSWVGVPPYSGAGTYTFQAILYPTGEIRYQYQALTGATNASTAGIQNGAKTIGLTVAYNTTYFHDNMAVRIAPLQQWLTVSPTSGRIHAGMSQNVDVRFNALGLVGGNFYGTVNVLSNDPDESDVPVSAHLHVIGAPDIAVNPASYDFGSVFVGSTNATTVSVTNPGTDDLVVSGITSDAAAVTVAPTSFTLTPGSGQAVTVTYHPTVVGTTSATISITSNDPDSPLKTVAVTGTATPAPSFSVTPTSLDVSLLTNTATSRTLTIRNTGGSNYIWTAEALVDSPSGTVVVGSDATNVYVGKDEPNVEWGPTPLRAGGPDVFGYTYMDSDEAGGPTFSWVDIRAVGTQMPMDGDDRNTGPYPIGFSFPFYGKTFTTFRASTNGWVSFTNATLTALSNTTLPNTGSSVPENLLAAFWDDLNFGTGNRRAYYYNDGTRLIIQYQDVPRYSSGGPYTFEIILYPNGTIVYQYLSMAGTRLNEATIGMQNEAKNDGLQVVYNANYVKNSLAIRFRPPAKFLTVSPVSGTVPAGGTTNLTVGFNAADLFGGDYTGMVRIRGNDPVVPQFDVPSVLHVTGVPDVATNPTSIEFGNVFIGYPAVRTMLVKNTGTDVLHVTGITITDPDYGVDQSVFDVPAQGSALLTVSFNPSAAMAHPATMTIASNDPDTPMYIVPLNGTGLVPPDIGSTPASLTSTLPIPSSETQMVTLHNTGGSDLTFSLGTTLSAISVPVYEGIDLGKDDADPRPGVRGSGGPDVYGYTWRDSDEPTGPAFGWVDITSVGTPVNLTGDDQNVAGIPLGFNFPFYGGTFSSVNVCTNGWLSFTNTTSDYTNDPLPNTAAPENLLAAFWDDLTFSTAGDVYYHNDGGRFIVEYVAVPRLGSGGPYTFEIILYPSGTIVYQYLDMQGTRLNEATIGIQNGTKNDGLTVAHNVPYMHNNLAIEFRTLPDWMTASPTSGTIPAGGSMDIQVVFNSTDMFGGTYHGQLRFLNNDPDEGLFVVPATLTAIGVADIAAAPASLDFGTIYVSQYADRQVRLMNAGSDVLTINSLALTDPTRYFLLDPPALPLTLGKNGSVTLTVRFEPPDACWPPNPCVAQLQAGSNDPDEAVLAVDLSGFALIPPEADPDPNSLRAALATTLGPSAISRTKTLALWNRGGSDLTWTAVALSRLPASLNSVPSGETDKDHPGTAGEATVLANGGPDAYGYRWADSDDPVLGTPFDWIDITGVGTPVPLTGDDQNVGPFPLPFPFTYYGNTYTSYRACSNGWISFTSTATALSNTALPNTSAPENILAAFWDDLDLRTSGRVYSHYDGSRFIIEYHAVPRYSTGGPYTFEIILYPSGTIDFQYLDMQGTRLNEATIGIQNSTKDIGLQIVYNAAYVKNNLRVRFSSQPGWLTVAPASGTVPAGEKADLAVGFNATGLADGDYTGAIRISSNDLTDPVIDVPCDLHVGVKTVSWDLDPNTVNRSSNGNWMTGYVEPTMDHDPHTIRLSSVLAERTVPVAPDSPVDYVDMDHDGLMEAMFKFDRIALMSLLPSGSSVPVEVIGEFEDMTWFQAVDNIRVLKPRITASSALDGGMGSEANAVLVAGSILELYWDDPEGDPVGGYDLWFTSDGANSWKLERTNMSVNNVAWQVPATETKSGRLELAAMDRNGIMGSWFSNSFDIVLAPTGIGDTEALPKEFSMRLKGRNPLPAGTALLELALPATSDAAVRIYDVRGTLVREMVSRSLAPGRHGVTWDGRNASGTPVGSGVYFVRTQLGGKTFNLKVAVAR
jgi:subtilisin family serine protease